MKLKAWTIGRATGLGVAAGLIALVLWPLYASWQEPLLVPFIAALAIAAFCGLSILVITAFDMLRRQRGEALRPVRTFDLMLGTALAVPSMIELYWLV